MKRVSLTTKDNPFDPFEDFIKWNSFDVEKGYNTCSKIAKEKQEIIDLFFSYLKEFGYYRYCKIII